MSSRDLKYRRGWRVVQSAFINLYSCCCVDRPYQRELVRRSGRHIDTAADRPGRRTARSSNKLTCGNDQPRRCPGAKYTACAQPAGVAECHAERPAPGGKRFDFRTCLHSKRDISPRRLGCTLPVGGRSIPLVIGRCRILQIDRREYFRRGVIRWVCPASAAVLGAPHFGLSDADYLACEFNGRAPQ